ncbi:hypothetical protein [Microbacterium allomyrinae]|uniref:Uncharacterized protein n=1 Tax=Microbacterium allomyrinae TaxID=2830666 RepID=A0A9X1LUC6_9MICO|nr:hypothetical protein [Microbacterium allomyrinae]MCC2031823.1 hypothetical protein [Microbacterium allomyrinae]
MQRSTEIRKRVRAFAAALWGASASLRDADVDRLVARIIPVVQGGQLQVANITNAYIQRLAELEGVTATATAVNRDQVVGYRGVPAADVYRRPAVATYAALAAGKPFEKARAEGLHRLESIVTTDIQQARTRQARAGYEQTGFDYTLRVLSGAENCALCVIASTQRYHLSDLQPMHPGCDCGERGVKAGRDPGQVIDADLLELTHTQIESKLGYTDRNARDLLRGKTDSRGRPISDFTELIVTREHGELGPTLTWRSDQFTAEADIDALH